MARLFGLIGNRADVAGRVMVHEAFALRVARGAASFGVGFYEGEEVLVRRRPVLDGDAVDVASLLANVRCDSLIAHVACAEVEAGGRRADNTHPFRYRQWLFAQTGRVAGFDEARDALVSSVPDFLRSGIRGDTDAEVLFHMFLSFLHDAGQLGGRVAAPTAAADALRSAVVQADAVTSQFGAGAPGVNILATDGHTLVGFNGRGGLALRTFAGRADADAILGDDGQLARRIPELERVSFSLVASDFDSGSAPPGWKAVADRAMVTVTRGSDAKIEVR